MSKANDLLVDAQIDLTVEEIQAVKLMLREFGYLSRTKQRTAKEIGEDLIALEGLLHRLSEEHREALIREQKEAYRKTIPKKKRGEFPRV